MSDQINRVVSSKVVLLQSFFNNATAFVIPSYQRAYSWDQDKVRNLIADIYGGICSLGSAHNPNEEYNFFGTVITVEKTRNFMNYGPNTPSVFHEIVDGQQRITTLSIIAIQLEEILRQQMQLVVSDNNYADYANEISQVTERYCAKLQALYSINSSTDQMKYPLIIREEVDRWQEGGYKSVISNLLLRHIHRGRIRINIPTNDLVTSNAKYVFDVLSKLKNNDISILMNAADTASADDYILDIPHIIYRLTKLELWDISNCKFDNHAVSEHHTNSSLVSLVRMLLFAYYMVKKCVMNHIIASKENWAFDMFVALNTTGVPLTAIETFRADLLNYVQNHIDDEYRSSVSKGINELYTQSEYGIHAYFDSENDSEKKIKKTKEFVTTYALAFNGQRIGFEIKKQRMWLRMSFESLISMYSPKSSRDRKDAMQRYVYQIQFLLQYLSAWENLVKKQIQFIDNVNENRRIDLAMLCIYFLNDVNHTIVHSLLSRFYEQVIQKKANAIDNFIDMIFAVTAFFALWRSVRGTSGLPDVYREGMSDYFSYMATNKQTKSFELNVADVKKYLRAKLNVNDGKDLLDKQTWILLAERGLRFRGMQDLSRFVLFISINNTTKDKDDHRLMIPATSGFAVWADQYTWQSSQYATIEHIAPQNPGQNTPWDKALYDERDLYDRIGNLTLLPTSINSSVGNSSWASKWIYYKHLAEVNPHEINNLQILAQNAGVQLRPNTIKLLRNAKFNYHMESIVAVGIDGKWDADLVEKRTTRMLEIFHARMLEWLQ